MSAASLLRVALLVTGLFVASGYYLPGTFPQAWLYGEELSADVNSLKSYETELPFDYYSLPFCKPGGGVQKSSRNVNIGTFLTGQRMENSPYNFTMMVNEAALEACDGDGFYGPLSNHEAKNLQEKVKQSYRVNLVLDNLPVTTYDLEEGPESVRTGFELGFVGGNGVVYINNHIMFRILVHPVTAAFLTAREQFYAAEMDARRRQLLEDAAANRTGGVLFSADDNVYYTVVGFEAQVCSIRRDPGWATFPVSCPGVKLPNGTLSTSTKPNGSAPKPQKVAEGEKIVYTYDVAWEVSDIKWVSRWDTYLRMPRGKVHWFSILNSVMVVVLLSGVVALIMFRTVRRDLAKYEEFLLSDVELEAHKSQPGGKDPDAGWKVLMGDVFRAPANTNTLCMMVGSGLQIFASCIVTLVFGALGFLSPAVRGALLSTLLGVYMLLSVVAGFSSVYLYGALNRSYDGWRVVAIRGTLSVPVILTVTLLCLNLVIKHTGSSGAIPFLTLLPISLTWLMVAFPLGCLGGLTAAWLPVLEWPTRTNPIPREVPNDNGESGRMVFMFFASGLLVFGNIFVELYFAMTSMWQGYFYYLLGFVLVICLLTVIITVQIAIVTTYMQFCLEDYHWWWQSFHRGGSVAWFVAVYAVGFLIWSLHILSGFTSVFLYLVYMSMLAGAIYASLGSIGFVASLWFTYKIFATAKAD